MVEEYIQTFSTNPCIRNANRFAFLRNGPEVNSRLPVNDPLLETQEIPVYRGGSNRLFKLAVFSVVSAGLGGIAGLYVAYRHVSDIYHFVRPILSQ